MPRAPKASAAPRLREAGRDGLQAIVVEMCKVMRLLCYHPYNSQRSTAGFLDNTIVGTRLIFREIKSDDGRISPAQQMWIDALREAGQDADVWRPADLRSGRIFAELKAIQKPTKRTGA